MPEEIPEADVILRRPMSAIPAIAVLVLIVCAIARCTGGSQSDTPPKSTAVTAGAAQNAAAPANNVAPPRDLPLRPPPSDACVTKDWCGERLGNASIIVDEGRRGTDLPKRAWVIAVATAMQESSLDNEASNKYAETLRFPYAKVGGDHDSVGLFQQRPSTGWGNPSELMNPRVTAKKFYGSLKDKIKNRPGWEKEPLTDIAQAVQRSAFPKAYQQHEATAVKIVDFVLGFVFTPDLYKSTANNSWFVMFQCAKPKAYACQEIPWHLIKPVADNYDAFKKHWPQVELNDHLGDYHHQNADPPEDHTSGAEGNIFGWIYAQDFGTGPGFDLNRFVRWLIDQVRAGMYNDQIKYIITTIPANKNIDGGRYYGIIKAKNGWNAAPHDPDHADHVHISYKVGCERIASTIVEDYYRFSNGSTVPASVHSDGGSALFY